MKISMGKARLTRSACNQPSQNNEERRASILPPLEFEVLGSC